MADYILKLYKDKQNPSQYYAELSISEEITVNSIDGTPNERVKKSTTYYYKCTDNNGDLTSFKLINETEFKRVAVDSKVDPQPVFDNNAQLESKGNVDIVQKEGTQQKTPHVGQVKAAVLNHLYSRYELKLYVSKGIKQLFIELSCKFPNNAVVNNLNTKKYELVNGQFQEWKQASFPEGVKPAQKNSKPYTKTIFATSFEMAAEKAAKRKDIVGLSTGNTDSNKEKQAKSSAAKPIKALTVISYNVYKHELNNDYYVSTGITVFKETNSTQNTDELYFYKLKEDGTLENADNNIASEIGMTSQFSGKFSSATENHQDAIKEALEIALQNNIVFTTEVMPLIFQAQLSRQPQVQQQQQQKVATPSAFFFSSVTGERHRNPKVPKKPVSGTTNNQKQQKPSIEVKFKIVKHKTNDEYYVFGHKITDQGKKVNAVLFSIRSDGSYQEISGNELLNLVGHLNVENPVFPKDNSEFQVACDNETQIVPEIKKMLSSHANVMKWFSGLNSKKPAISFSTNHQSIKTQQPPKQPKSEEREFRFYCGRYNVPGKLQGKLLVELKYGEKVNDYFVYFAQINPQTNSFELVPLTDEEKKFPGMKDIEGLADISTQNFKVTQEAAPAKLLEKLTSDPKFDAFISEAYEKFQDATENKKIKVKYRILKHQTENKYYLYAIRNRGNDISTDIYELVKNGGYRKVSAEDIGEIVNSLDKENPIYPQDKSYLYIICNNEQEVPTAILNRHKNHITLWNYIDGITQTLEKTSSSSALSNKFILAKGFIEGLEHYKEICAENEVEDFKDCYFLFPGNDSHHFSGRKKVGFFEVKSGAGLAGLAGKISRAKGPVMSLPTTNSSMKLAREAVKDLYRLAAFRPGSTPVLPVREKLHEVFAFDMKTKPTEKLVWELIKKFKLNSGVLNFSVPILLRYEDSKTQAVSYYMYGYSSIPDYSNERVLVDVTKVKDIKEFVQKIVDKQVSNKNGIKPAVFTYSEEDREYFNFLEKFEPKYFTPEQNFEEDGQFFEPNFWGGVEMSGDSELAKFFFEELVRFREFLTSGSEDVSMLSPELQEAYNEGVAARLQPVKERPDFYLTQDEYAEKYPPQKSSVFGGFGFGGFGERSNKNKKTNKKQSQKQIPEISSSKTSDSKSQQTDNTSSRGIPQPAVPNITSITTSSFDAENTVENLFPEFSLINKGNFSGAEEDTTDTLESNEEQLSSADSEEPIAAPAFKPVESKEFQSKIFVRVCYSTSTADEGVYINNYNFLVKPNQELQDNYQKYTHNNDLMNALYYLYAAGYELTYETIEQLQKYDGAFAVQLCQLIYALSKADPRKKYVLPKDLTEIFITNKAIIETIFPIAKIENMPDLDIGHLWLDYCALSDDEKAGYLDSVAIYNHNSRVRKAINICHRHGLRVKINILTALQLHDKCKLIFRLERLNCLTSDILEIFFDNDTEKLTVEECVATLDRLNLSDAHYAAIFNAIFTKQPTVVFLPVSNEVAKVMHENAFTKDPLVAAFQEIKDQNEHAAYYGLKSFIREYKLPIRLLPLTTPDKKENDHRNDLFRVDRDFELANKVAQGMSQNEHAKLTIVTALPEKLSKNFSHLDKHIDEKVAQIRTGQALTTSLPLIKGMLVFLQKQAFKQYEKGKDEYHTGMLESRKIFQKIEQAGGIDNLTDVALISYWEDLRKICKERVSPLTSVFSSATLFGLKQARAPINGVIYPTVVELQDLYLISEGSIQKPKQALDAWIKMQFLKFIDTEIARLSKIDKAIQFNYDYESSTSQPKIIAYKAFRAELMDNIKNNPDMTLAQFLSDEPMGHPNYNSDSPFCKIVVQEKMIAPFKGFLPDDIQLIKDILGKQMPEMETLIASRCNVSILLKLKEALGKVVGENAREAKRLLCLLPNENDVKNITEGKAMLIDRNDYDREKYSFFKTMLVAVVDKQVVPFEKFELDDIQRMVNILNDKMPKNLEISQESFQKSEYSFGVLCELKKALNEVDVENAEEAKRLLDLLPAEYYIPKSYVDERKHLRRKLVKEKGTNNEPYFINANEDSEATFDKVRRAAGLREFIEQNRTGGSEFNVTTKKNWDAKLCELSLLQRDVNSIFDTTSETVTARPHPSNKNKSEVSQHYRWQR